MIIGLTNIAHRIGSAFGDPNDIFIQAYLTLPERRLQIFWKILEKMSSPTICEVMYVADSIPLSCSTVLSAVLHIVYLTLRHTLENRKYILEITFF